MKRRFGLPRTRYFGRAKVHAQMVMAAIVQNLLKAANKIKLSHQTPKTRLPAHPRPTASSSVSTERCWTRSCASRCARPSTKPSKRARSIWTRGWCITTPNGRIWVTETWAADPWKPLWILLSEKVKNIAQMGLRPDRLQAAQRG